MFLIALFSALEVMKAAEQLLTSNDLGLIADSLRFEIVALIDDNPEQCDRVKMLLAVMRKVQEMRDKFDC